MAIDCAVAVFVDGEEGWRRKAQLPSVVVVEAWGLVMADIGLKRMDL